MKFSQFSRDTGASGERGHSMRDDIRSVRHFVFLSFKSLDTRYMLNCLADESLSSAASARERPHISGRLEGDRRSWKTSSGVGRTTQVRFLLVPDHSRILHSQIPMDIGYDDRSFPNR